MADRVKQFRGSLLSKGTILPCRPPPHGYSKIIMIFLSIRVWILFISFSSKQKNNLFLFLFYHYEIFYCSIIYSTFTLFRHYHKEFLVLSIASVTNDYIREHNYLKCLNNYLKYLNILLNLYVSYRNLYVYVYICVLILKSKQLNDLM